MKKLFLSLAVLAGVVALVGKTNLVSYTRAAWSFTKQEAKDAIPTPFELKRVRLEIAQLDQDVNQILRPLAELKSEIVQLERDIERQQTNLANQKDSLLIRTKDLTAGQTNFSYGNKVYSADQVKQSVQRDFEMYQRLEKHIETLKKLVSAKQSAFETSQEQLAQFQLKRREYEVRLAQLEADEEALKVARLGARVPVDDRRPAHIEQSLQEIERRQQVQRFELELAQGTSIAPIVPVPTKTKTDDAASILNYLQGQ